MQQHDIIMLVKKEKWGRDQRLHELKKKLNRAAEFFWN